MPTSIAKLAFVTAAPLAAGTAVAEVFGDEHIRLVISLVAVVGVVVGAVTWMRNQTKVQIDAHAEQDKQRHRAVLQEIRHLRELLAVKLGLPAPHATGEFPICAPGDET
jgi:hypothetical protein